MCDSCDLSGWCYNMHSDGVDWFRNGIVCFSLFETCVDVKRVGLDVGLECV